MDPIVAKLHETLKPLGFTRRSRRWNRRSADLVDVVSIRTDKSRSGLQLDVGVLDVGLYRLCWSADPPEMADAADCSVASDIGLVGGVNQARWSVADPSIAEHMQAAVSDVGVPFLDRMHDPAAMASYLESRPSLFSGYAPPVIYLAGLRHRLGESTAACELLQRITTPSPSTWSAHVEQARQRLGC